MDINKLIKELTLEEKIALVSGTDFMYTNPVPRLYIKSVSMSDGPHGLRKQAEGNTDNGVSISERATSFPTAVTTASSWNSDNLAEMTKAIAAECIYYDVDVLLGPGVNIKRNPLCGRNFEYFSEDPILSADMGTQHIKGLQSNGVLSCVKHFALNNAENYRFVGNSICDQKAIRELYLKPFELIAKKANPATFMCAYNRINGTFCSQNKELLTDILRDQWGYSGAVMTDWGATHNRVEGIQAGLDIEMPGDTDICRKWIFDAINNGSLSIEELDKAVINVLNLCNIVESNRATRTITKEYLTEQIRKEHHELACKIACDSAVLLKNKGSLPLAKQDKIFVVGELFEKMRYQGSGSSMINPAYITTPKNDFDNRNISYVYSKGYKENTIKTDKALIDEAIEHSKDFDKVLIFAGLNDYVESEGCDRDNMKLPQNQIDLIQAFCNQGKKIVLVLFGGSPIELPFIDKIDSVLCMYLPGQNGGSATGKLLFGEVNPSGHLAETWPLSYECVPFGNLYSKEANEIYYESIYSGYRYYVSHKDKVLFPFGYGLSYTDFEYRDLQVEYKEGQFFCSCKIKNTGSIDGKTVVQLYVKSPHINSFGAEKELKSYKKVFIKSGEEITVDLCFSKEEVMQWDTKAKEFYLQNGMYTIELCYDSFTVAQSKTVLIEEGRDCSVQEIPYCYKTGDFNGFSSKDFETLFGSPLPIVQKTKKITVESRFTDLKQTLMGRILYKAVLSVADKQYKEAMKMEDCTEKDNRIKGSIFLRRILDSNSIISMSMCGAKTFPYNFAKGFVDFANGHLIKGAVDFMSKIKAPALPKDRT